MNVPIAVMTAMTMYMTWNADNHPQFALQKHRAFRDLTPVTPTHSTQPVERTWMSRSTTRP